MNDVLKYKGNAEIHYTHPTNKTQHHTIITLEPDAEKDLLNPECKSIPILMRFIHEGGVTEQDGALVKNGRGLPRQRVDLSGLMRDKTETYYAGNHE